MAAGSIKLDIPDYLKAPFEEEVKSGVDENKDKYFYNMDIELERPVTYVLDEIIKKIHSKPREIPKNVTNGKEFEEGVDPKTTYMSD